MVNSDRRPGDIVKMVTNTEKAKRLLSFKTEKNLYDICKDAFLFEKANCENKKLRYNIKNLK